MIPIDQLIRTNRKTISLAITQEGKLVVRAPLRLPKSRIEELVNCKVDWITRHQAQVRQGLPAMCADRITDGQHFWYLGQPYELKVVDRQSPALSFDGALLSVAPGDGPPAGHRLCCEA